MYLRIIPVAMLAAFVMALPAQADSARDAILAAYLKEAKAADPGFAGFSAGDGKTFWFATQSGGKPETNSCTACHTKHPTAQGQTKVGKAIEPMAVSANAKRFTEAEKVAKWFLRNCNTVLGRQCTAAEKGNVITYLSSQ